MNAFIEFNKGIMRMPFPWRLWLMLLVTMNLAMPLFFLGLPTLQRADPAAQEPFELA